MKKSLPAGFAEKIEAGEEFVPGSPDRMTGLNFPQCGQLTLQSILDHLAQKNTEEAPDIKAKVIAENLHLAPLDLAEQLKQI